MSDKFASFKADFVFGTDFSATRSTTASFQADFVFGGQWNANVNALTLTPDAKTPLTFSVDTPGSLAP